MAGNRRRKMSFLSLEYLGKYIALENLGYVGRNDPALVDEWVAENSAGKFREDRSEMMEDLIPDGKNLCGVCLEMVDQNPEKPIGGQDVAYRIRVDVSVSENGSIPDGLKKALENYEEKS